MAEDSFMYNGGGGQDHDFWENESVGHYDFREGLQITGRWKQALRPITIHQLLSATKAHSEDDFKVDDNYIYNVIIVAFLVHSEWKATNNDSNDGYGKTTLYLEDGTGKLTAYHNTTPGTPDSHLHLNSLQYVRIVGTPIKTRSPLPALKVSSLVIVTDVHEVYAHALHVMAVTHAYKHGPPSPALLRSLTSGQTRIPAPVPCTSHVPDSPVAEPAARRIVASAAPPSTPTRFVAVTAQVTLPVSSPHDTRSFPVVNTPTKPQTPTRPLASAPYATPERPIAGTSRSLTRHDSMGTATSATVVQSLSPLKSLQNIDTPLRGPRRDPYSHLTTLQRHIMLEIMNASRDNDHEGVHVSVIARGVRTLNGGRINVKDISDALDGLMDEGEIYSTIDESHFQITDNSRPPYELL